MIRSLTLFALVLFGVGNSTSVGAQQISETYRKVNSSVVIVRVQQQTPSPDTQKGPRLISTIFAAHKPKYPIIHQLGSLARSLTVRGRQDVAGVEASQLRGPLGSPQPPGAAFWTDQSQASPTKFRTWTDSHTDQLIIAGSLILGSWLIGKSICLNVS